MAKKEYNTVDEYIASQPEAVRSMLESVRSAIRKASPEAEEGISYRIPAYKLHGGPLLYFAAWKKHYSLYPVREQLVAKIGSSLAPYHVEKATLRFPFSEPVPVELIERIANFRVLEAAKKK